MPACKDCKHFRRFWLDIGLSKCARPSLYVDPRKYFISGKKVIKPEFCSVQRTSVFPEDCGILGKHFEPKKRFWL